MPGLTGINLRPCTAFQGHGGNTYNPSRVSKVNVVERSEKLTDCSRQALAIGFAFVDQRSLFDTDVIIERPNSRKIDKFSR